MKERFRLIRRNGSVFYLHDNQTGKRESLNIKDRATAQILLATRRESSRQTFLNLEIARTYAAASDPRMIRRSWRTVFEEIVLMKQGSTRLRWEGAAKDRAIGPLLPLPLMETHAEHFFKALKAGSVSTNIYLRRAHNFALGMNWLLAPVIPKKQWPKIRFKDKRAITWDEHRRIVEREPNAEWKAYFELAWRLGASQSDLAGLKAEDISWPERIVSFDRMKIRLQNRPAVHISFADAVAEILKILPTSGPLFPRISELHEKHRAKHFRRRCIGLGIEGVSLHSYRYSWAERAMTAGMPERFDMAALGHGSKAVHRAYSRKAQLKLPALEDYEEKASEGKILPVRRLEPSGCAFDGTAKSFLSPDQAKHDLCPAPLARDN